MLRSRRDRCGRASDGFIFPLWRGCLLAEPVYYINTNSPSSVYLRCRCVLTGCCAIAFLDVRLSTPASLQDAKGARITGCRYAIISSLPPRSPS